MNERKRIRGSNFTPEEELELVQNVYTYKHIIESKESNNTSRNEKDAAWSDIFHIFNSKFEPRTLNQLKSKYDNLKTLAKRLITEKKDNTCRSYIFHSSCIRQHIALDIVTSILNSKTQNSSENTVDCDPSYLNISEESNFHDDNQITPGQNYIKIKSEESSDNEYNSQPTHVSANEQNIYSQSTEIPKIKRNKKSRKRINPKIQEFIRIRNEYLKRKISLLEQESAEREKRMKLDEEMHEMKLKNLRLDISIKEEELKRLRKI